MHWIANVGVQYIEYRIIIEVLLKAIRFCLITDLINTYMFNIVHTSSHVHVHGMYMLHVWLFLRPAINCNLNRSRFDPVGKMSNLGIRYMSNILY